MSSKRFLPAAMAVLAFLVPVSAQEGSAAGGAFHMFTSPDGRVIRARVLAANDQEITILRADSEKFTLPVARLSEADQAYVRELRSSGKVPATLTAAPAPSAGKDPGPGSGPLEIKAPQGAVQPPFAFSKFEGREKKTPHFLIRYSTSTWAPYDKLCEDAFKVMAAAVPGLIQTFEQAKFSAPDSGPNYHDVGADRRFRLSIYLPKNHAEFTAMAEENAARHTDAARRLESLASALKFGGIDDPENRFWVFQPLQDNGTKQLGFHEPFFAHNIAGALIRAHSGRSATPLWLTAGLGYMVEHALKQVCTVHYIDFNKYYDSLVTATDDKGKQKKSLPSAIFSPKDPWPPILKKLAREDKLPSAEMVIAAVAQGLTPEASAAMLSLVMFLTSDDAKRASFEKMLQRLRKDGKVDAEGVIADYGFRDIAELDAQHKAYVLSAKFK